MNFHTRPFIDEHVEEALKLVKDERECQLKETGSPYDHLPGAAFEILLIRDCHRRADLILCRSQRLDVPLPLIRELSALAFRFIQQRTDGGRSLELEAAWPTVREIVMKKAPDVPKHRTVADYILQIDPLVRELVDNGVSSYKQNLDTVTKIAAICVVCMTHHKTPPRNA